MRIPPAIAKSMLLIFAALTLFMLPSFRLPYVDEKADAYFSDTMRKAGLAYGACRAVNASVSVIKESRLQIDPTGLKVALAAGQILDPLDDMTERASDILVTAIASLGVQKIAYQLSVTFAPPLIGVSIIVLVGVSLLQRAWARALQTVVQKSLMIIAVARLCLPLSAVVSSYLNDHFFSPRIAKAKDELARSCPEMDRLEDMEMPEVDGVWGIVKNGFGFLGPGASELALVLKKTSELALVLKAMIQNRDVMVSSLLQLSSLYVALFMIQVILLPTGVFWILVRLTNALCGTTVPYILTHADFGKPMKFRAENGKA